MEQVDGDHHDDVSYQITEPQVLRQNHGHQPQDGDNHQREGKGDEECHVVLMVELVDNHEHVDVAEGYETECENA